jgi:hypothetical protein
MNMLCYNISSLMASLMLIETIILERGDWFAHADGKRLKDHLMC